MESTFLCACGRKEKQKKYLLLLLELQIHKLSGYDFPYPCHGLWNSHLFFKWLKAKAVPLHTTKALEWREGIAPTHSRPWH
jgi:hypothetical protein